MKTNYWFNQNRLLSGLRFIALLLACFAIPQSSIAVTPAEEDNLLLDLITGTDTPALSFPLKKSANNRYLTDQNGTPFFMVGDSAWALIGQGTNADIDAYLADRAAKGFNTILTETIDPFLQDNAPNNIENVAPFTVPSNFNTANPAYYTRVDYLIDQAAARGMVALVFPLYLGYNCGNQGWAAQVETDTTAHIQSYAAFVGNRYKNKGNIIWVMGGDVDPFNNANCGPTVGSKLNAFAAALVAADPNHLVTAHVAPRGIDSITPWISQGVPSWFTLNSTYTNELSFTSAQTAYNRTPVRPFFLLEAQYENGPNVTRKDLRAEAYWSILSGNCGYVYGNCPLFGFGATVVHNQFCSGTALDWHLQLNSTGAQDVTRFKNLFTSVAWQTLVPDFTHTTVTAGYGSGVTTVTTSRASDGSFVISYLPAVSGITVNMTRLSGSSVAARWYDPTNGTYTNVAGSPFPSTGTRVFTPTGNNSSGASDWVLLLQSTTSPTPTPTPIPSVTCSLLQKRLDRLQLRQQRLQRLARSNKKLNERIRRLRLQRLARSNKRMHRLQLQLQACL